VILKAAERKQKLSSIDFCILNELLWDNLRRCTSSVNYFHFWRWEREKKDGVGGSNGRHFTSRGK
jgi:hypothetical protein